MPAAYDNYDYPAYWKGREYEHSSEFLAIKEMLLKIPRISRSIEIGAGFGEPSNDMPFESPQMSAQLGAPAQPQRYPSPAQMAAQQTSPVMPQAVPGYQITNRDVELILSKLDLIKSSLDNLSQRVAALEKIAKGETNW